MEHVVNVAQVPVSLLVVVLVPLVVVVVVVALAVDPLDCVTGRL